MSPQLLVKVKHTDNTQMTQGETLADPEHPAVIYFTDSGMSGSNRRSFAGSVT